METPEFYNDPPMDREFQPSPDEDMSPLELALHIANMRWTPNIPVTFTADPATFGPDQIAVCQGRNWGWITKNAVHTEEGEWIYIVPVPWREVAAILATCDGWIDPGDERFPLPNRGEKSTALDLSGGVWAVVTYYDIIDHFDELT
jgi:hypothetical protein